MLEYQSESDRSRVKLGRRCSKIKHQQASKRRSKINLLKKPNLKLTKKEIKVGNGKRKATMANMTQRRHQQHT
jgi:hypothetical protein